MPGASVSLLPPAGGRRLAWAGGMLPAALAGAASATLALLGGEQALGLLLLSLLVLAILVYPIVGVTTLLVIAPAYILLTPFIPPGIPVAFLLLLLTGVAVALRRVHEPRSGTFTWRATDWLAAFLLVNGLVYIPLSGNIKVGVYGYHENLRLFLIYFLIRWLRPGRPAVRAMLWTTALMAFGVALYGCIQHFTGYDTIMVRYGLEEQMRGYAGFNKAGVQRAYSVTSSPIQLGLLAMMMSLAAAGVLARPGARDAAWRLAPAALVVGIGAALVSYTRSAWLGLVAGLVLATLLLVRGRARAALLAAPLLLGWGIAHWLPEVGERMGRYALTIISRDPVDTSFHYFALLEAARFFWSHKLGVGLGTASFAGANVGTGVRVWSENTFFLMGIQTGMQGLLALVAFLGATLLAGRNLVRHAGADALAGRLGGTALLGAVAFAVSGLSLPVLLDVGAFAPLWAAIALVGNLREERVPGSAEAADGVL